MGHFLALEETDSEPRSVSELKAPKTVPTLCHGYGVYVGVPIL